MKINEIYQNLLKFVENNKKYQKIYPKNRIFVKISGYKAENKSLGVFLHPRSI